MIPRDLEIPSLQFLKISNIVDDTKYSQNSTKKRLATQHAFKNSKHQKTQILKNLQVSIGVGISIFEGGVWFSI